MTTAVEINYNLDRLAIVAKQYAAASGKDEGEVIKRMAKKFSRNLYLGLRQLKPVKGSIRQTRIEKLKQGIGTHVRQAVYDDVAARYNALPLAGGKMMFRNRKGRLVGSNSRGLNLQALAVQRELSVRESGRGFAAHTTPNPSRASSDNDEVDVLSRYGFLLSELQLHAASQAETKYALFRYRPRSNGGDYQSAVDALAPEQQLKVVNQAIKDATADTLEYIKRKQRETIAAFFGL